MDTVKVVCGLVFQEDKVLICRRKPDKSLGSYWEFPGGKVEAGESESLALQRELREELGMEVLVDDCFKTVAHRYEHVRIELTAYTCRFVSASYTLADHDCYAWVIPSALADYTLAPADVPIAEALMFA